MIQRSQRISLCIIIGTWKIQAYFTVHYFHWRWEAELAVWKAHEEQEMQQKHDEETYPCGKWASAHHKFGFCKKCGKGTWYKGKCHWDGCQHHWCAAISDTADWEMHG